MPTAGACQAASAPQPESGIGQQAPQIIEKPRIQTQPSAAFRSANVTVAAPRAMVAYTARSGPRRVCALEIADNLTRNGTSSRFSSPM